jgi:23S rRNA (uridine2552-2'-O)-methyltransferase
MPRPGVPDAYRRQAQAEGFVSRAVFKLQAMDARFHLFRPGQRVLDLGCHPGSWMQYLASRVGPTGMVVGVDLATPKLALVPPLYFVPGDVQSIDLAEICTHTSAFDAVVSDLAPKTTGVRLVDQQRSLNLACRAWEIAQALLVPGGHFLVKVFSGPDVELLVTPLKKAFSAFHRVKPPGSRQESFELYLLGLGRRPPAGASAGGLETKETHAGGSRGSGEGG